MKQKYGVTIFCLLVCFILFSGTALAHKVTVFAWVEGNKVLGESKFSGGKRPQGSEVIVWDTQGNELLRTKTDDNGEFSFALPKRTAMRIELLAGMGHKAEWTIALEDIPEDAVPAAGSDKSQGAAADAPPPPAKETAPSIDKAELEAIVQKAVETSLNKKITPLTKMVADLSEHGPGPSEIIGGIGYIFGLMGIFLYFKSRRKEE